MDEKEILVKDILERLPKEALIAILTPTPERDNKWIDELPSARVEYEGQVKDTPYIYAEDEIGDMFMVPDDETGEPILNLVRIVYVAVDPEKVDYE